MAKNTINCKYQSFDAAHNLRREVHSYKKNSKELYFEYTPNVEETSTKPTPSIGLPPDDFIASSAKSSSPQPALSQTVVHATALLDHPVSAEEIVKLIVAQTLRKNVLEVPDNSSIKSLAGGRSTLQNEIIGDLTDEFGGLPAGSEDMPLQDLASMVQESFGGKLGNRSSSMIAKMASSMLPGTFNLAKSRKYLLDRWGFGSGRQDSVLILAVHQKPTSRIGSETDAKAFLDSIAQKYAEIKALSLNASSGGDENSLNTSLVLDKASLDHLQAEQKSLNQAVLEVYARSLNTDLHQQNQLTRRLQADAADLLGQLDLWRLEHGEVYAAGIKPMFDPLKARSYLSSWNWVIQDLFALFGDIVSGRSAINDPILEEHISMLKNRANPKLITALKYLKASISTGVAEPMRQSCNKFLEELHQTCEKAMDSMPTTRIVKDTLGPLTTIDNVGNVEYSEIPRLRERVIDNKDGKYGDMKDFKAPVYPYQKPNIDIVPFEAPSTGPPSSDGFSDNTPWTMATSASSESDPPSYGSHALPRANDFIHIRKKVSSVWEIDQLYTSVYLNSMESAASCGMSFQEKQILVTGAGPGSIGGEVVQRLISGGARVIVTTSSYSDKTTRHFQSMFSRYGSRGAELVLVPFNQGSKQDVENLANYIFRILNWDLDHIIPFAAISENGSEIDNIGSRSELAHRIMLTNLVRLLGAVKSQKDMLGSRTRPAQVILPLSPNHGIFGNDGLYSESKVALEALFNKWHSESWDEYLSISGAIIGWTRGTALMKDNDLVSYGMEKMGIHTFSQQEMASHILGLMTPLMVGLTELGPIIADLSGGMNAVSNLKELVTNVRQNINEISNIRRVIAKEQDLIKALHTTGNHASATVFTTRANIKFEFPRLPNYSTDIAPLSAYRKGMLDLDKVVVVAGFAEIGPLGNSRTRWEIEAYGELSVEGHVELAWIMGLIKYQKKTVGGKSSYSGLIDVESREPISDQDVKVRYGKHIIDHTGIRLIENRSLDGPQEHAKQFLQEISIQEDLLPFETTKEAAFDLQREHGEKAVIIQHGDSYSVQLKKGACVFLPKSSTTGRSVGGQVPAGWDPKLYGISEDIINQVDRVTLYTLVATVEALLSAGITDPYELYQHIHISEVGNMIGAGMGGLTSLDRMFRQRVLEKQVQKDILQETFVNTTAAWVNMLLIAGAGTTVTPVAACATALESLHVGYETILSGKAKVCLVGGCDDMSHTSRHEFRNMGATVDPEIEFRKGREPKEMSRPTTTTRSGFVESEGAGVQVITTASLALDMGLPIHGVVAFTHTANDKQGRSVPAPGSGLLTSVTEVSTKYPLPLLSARYRHQNLQLRMQEIDERRDIELGYLESQAEAVPSIEMSELEEARRNINHAAERQRKEIQNTFGNAFWKGEPRISALRGSLGVFGLTVDDITVASFHGTSTRKNELNESKILHTQMQHLGRTPGNPLLAVCQKALTGHPKGAAAAWMLNGALQAMHAGLIPGNRNADDIDPELQQFEHITYPSRNIERTVNAATVTSFGFGQKGAQAIVVNPKFLFASIEEEQFEAYERKRKIRHRKAARRFHEGMFENSVFIAKDVGPFPEEMTEKWLTNRDARVAA